MLLEIVTPEGAVYSEQVDSVVLPGIEGEMGILPGHIPLMTQIAPGELVVSKAGQTTRLAVGEGFIEVTQDHVAVLTDMAIEEKAIDEAAAERAIERAKAAMAEHALGSEEAAAVQASIARATAQLNVKRRRRV